MLTFYILTIFLTSVRFKFFFKFLLKSHCFLSIPSLFFLLAIEILSSVPSKVAQVKHAQLQLKLMRTFHNDRNLGMHLRVCELDGGF